MQICWTRPAGEQLEAIHKYISESNVAAADQQITSLLTAIRKLPEFPESGRPVGFREPANWWSLGRLTSWCTRLRDSTVRILAIIHGARRWPLSFHP